MDVKLTVLLTCATLLHVSTVLSLSTDTPGVSKRQKIVNEICSSEQTYISQLSVIVDVSRAVIASLCHATYMSMYPQVGGGGGGVGSL